MSEKSKIMQNKKWESRWERMADMLVASQLAVPGDNTTQLLAYANILRNKDAIKKLQESKQPK